MAAEIPGKFVGLEKSIQDAAKNAGRNLKINLGTSARSIEALSQPLGRITGRADEFTKSMEAANARVLAFGASVGVLRSVTNSFKELVATTIQVEKQMASINAILGASTGELSKFKKEIFDVARNTEQSFETVSTAALELSRQGLAAEEVVKRLNDSLILSRLSGQSAADAVAGLTSAINGFKSSGIASTDVVNKFSEAAKSAAVSERDLAEAFKRAGAVAGQAGVTFDELVGIVSAVQEKTSRGGSVIGNSFKTIFTRIQSLEKLTTMQDLGVEVTDSAGQVLSATKIIQNLASVLQSFPDARRLQIAENLVGKFQVAPFISLLEDYNDETSKAIKITEISANATTAAYERNAALNLTLSAAINEARVNVEQLFETLGKIGVTEGLQNILGFFNNLVENLRGLLDEETGSDIAKGLVKGIGNVISGPGLAIFAAIIGKLTKDLVSFGLGSMRTFFGLNKAAKEQAAVQGQIASTLLGNSDIQKRILAIENSQLSTEQKKLAQTKFFTTALNEQLAVMQRMQTIATRVAPGVIAGTRARRGAGGYIPNFAGGSAFGSEQADINRGVGGAPRSARPVAIPNFNFGGGQRGTMVANTSEFIVPNFAGGSAIFNQNMAASMGLPAGARPVGAAGGYIPNFSVKLDPFSGKLKSRGNYFDAQGEPRSKAIREAMKKDDDIGRGLRAMQGANQVFKSSTGKGGPAGKGPYVMLVPQTGVRSIISKTFTKPRGPFKSFRGRAYGIKPNLEGTLNKFTNLENEIDESLAGAANKVVNFLSDDINLKPSPVTAGNLDALISSEGGPGAIGALKGAMFESILNAVIDASKFDSAASRERRGQLDIDFKPNRDLLEKIFGLPKKRFMLGDYKSSMNARGTYIDQVMINDGAYTRPKKGQAAGGYIPNYASDLENAIGREAAAGIPINQIRINQKGTLRNSANPMGLAVTNTRDEPTGAIPNFKKKTPDGSGEVAEANRDLLGTIFGVQMGLSLLTGATSDSENGLVKFTNSLASAASTLTTGLLAGQALGQMGQGMMGTQRTGFMGGLTKKFGGLIAVTGKVGIALAAAGAGFKLINDLYRDGSGITDLNNKAMANFNDKLKEATFSLNDFSEAQRMDLTEQINQALEKDTSGKLKNKLERGGINLGFGSFNEALEDPTVRRALTLGALKGFEIDDLIAIMMNERDKGRVLAGGAGRQKMKQVGDRKLTEKGEIERALKAIEDLADMGKLGRDFVSSFSLKLPQAAQNIVNKAKAISDNAGKVARALARNAQIETMKAELQEEFPKANKMVLDKVLETYERRIKEFDDNTDKLIDADKELISKTKALASVFEISKNIRDDFEATQKGIDARSARLSAGLLSADQSFNISRDQAILDKNRRDSDRLIDLANKIIQDTKNINLVQADDKLKEFINLDPEQVTFEKIQELDQALSTQADATSGELRRKILDFAKAKDKDDREHRIKLAKIDADAGAAQMDLAKASLKAAIDAKNRFNTFDLQFRRAMATGFERRSLTREINFLDEMRKLEDKPDGERIIAQASLTRAKELGDILDDASKNFVDSITNGLIDAIVQGESLGNVLRSAATDFFTMLSRAYMQQAVNSIVDRGGGGGGGGGNFLSTVLGFFGFNRGGMIRGGSGTRDDVPALLTGGEFVMRKSSVDKYGTGFMSALNQGAVPKFANGGMFVPGSYGQGAIRGKSDLLGFATQTGTSTAADRMVSGANFAAIALAPESIAMTSLGRSMSPAFKRTQEAKSQAFNLFVQQLQADEQRKEQLRQQAEAKKQQRRGLLASFGMAALSGFVFGGGLDNLFGGRKTTIPSTASTAPRYGYGADINPNIANPFAGPQIAPPASPVGALKAQEYLKLPSFFEGARSADNLLFLSSDDTPVYDFANRPMFQGFNPQPIPKFNRNPFAPLNRPMGGMIPYMAGGGGVGYAAGVDTVPAMLSGGEFVMNAAATSRIGASNLQALNSGASMGGGSTSITKGDTNINIVVNSNGSVNQNASADAGAADKGLAVRLKDAVKGVLAEETRLGGMLSA